MCVCGVGLLWSPFSWFEMSALPLKRATVILNLAPKSRPCNSVLYGPSDKFLLIENGYITEHIIISHVSWKRNAFRKGEGWRVQATFERKSTKTRISRVWEVVYYLTLKLSLREWHYIVLYAPCTCIVTVSHGVPVHIDLHVHVDHLRIRGGGGEGGRGGRGSDLFEMRHVFRKHANLWDAPLANNWSNYDVQEGPSQAAEHYLWTSRFYNHVLGARFTYKMIWVMYWLLRFLFISSAAVVQPRAVGIIFIIMSLQNRAAVTDLPYKVGGIRVRLP